MAYTGAPLQNWEHGADAFDPGDDEEDCAVAPASFMVTADHNSGKDDGGPLGRRFCRSGSKVVSNYPKPTRHMLMHHDTKNIGGGASGAVQLAG